MITEGEAGAGPQHVPIGADYVSDRKFVDFPLSRDVVQGILDRGYVMATPIQAVTIEPALAGRDIVARAKTGTGKTAAFAIPILELVRPDREHPQALVLAPTRELAQQIADEFEALSTVKRVRTVVLVGGMAMGPQEKALERGVDVVVGTPGRVLDMYRRKILKLSGVSFVCLDEADEMVSMGFYEDVTRILGATPDTRQVLLFSATLSPDTERIVRQFMKNPEQILLSTDSDRVEGIRHIAYEAPSNTPKARAMMYMLDAEDPEAAIIFCNTREDTNTVAGFLERQGMDVQLLSGELPQGRRNEVMRRVKAGEVRYLIATDVASRGIDISDLSHVFNYSLPQDPTVYLHRIGRTGRIGKKGTAISLLSGTDMGTLRVLENVHKIAFERRPFPDENEAVRKRVDRQAAMIRAAMGTLVFESYLPTARALRERSDGDLLMAAALRAFFAWDRQRRAKLADIVEPDGDTREPSDEAGPRATEATSAEARGGERGAARHERRPEKKQERREKPEKRRGDDERRPRERRGSSSDDLDALLIEGPAAVDLDALLQVQDAGDDLDALLTGGEPGPASAPEADEGAKKKKKKRRRKKKGAKVEGDATAATDAADDETDEAEVDDLDALLSEG